LEVQVNITETEDNDTKNELYKAGIDRFQNSFELISNYAVFLQNIRKDDEEDEEYYKWALEIAPEYAQTNGNYALFLQFRKDYEQAEEYYQRAVKTGLENAYHNGNYARLLLTQNRKSDAIPYIEKAEHLANEELDLLLELAFYRLAMFPESQEQSRQKILDLLEKGIRSPGWDFSGIITQAEKHGCEYLDELKNLATKISRID
jgi:tetratricopeptide (TPR) repeat protein